MQGDPWRRPGPWVRDTSLAALGVFIRKVNSSPPLRNDLTTGEGKRELWRYGARLAVFFTGMCQGLAGRCIRGESRPGLSSGVMADQMRLALASVPQTSYLHQSNWIKAANKTLYLYDWEGATVLKTLTRAIVASWIGLFVRAAVCMSCTILPCTAFSFLNIPSPLWELIGLIYTNNSKRACDKLI